MRRRRFAYAGARNLRPRAHGNEARLRRARVQTIRICRCISSIEWMDGQGCYRNRRGNHAAKCREPAYWKSVEMVYARPAGKAGDGRTLLLSEEVYSSNVLGAYPFWGDAGETGSWGK